ncbi:hypothetical protein KCP76_16130 [Salmonella enterica subsp. enterica serovar Weltevreden]|nr:hypothetical protein KCP76_16130 [Salmonella enterica subsp. enterica serovar Weltevreden]
MLSQTTHPALENVNFRLKPGGCWGYAVRPARGKAQSSLISAPFDVTQGIRFHDMPLTHLQLDSWRNDWRSSARRVRSPDSVPIILLGRPEATQEGGERVARLAAYMRIFSVCLGATTRR